MSNEKAEQSFDWSKVVWYNVTVVALWHVGAIYAALFLLPSASWTQILVLWICGWWFSGLGITAGSHRLWAHKAYKARLPLRVFLMLMNSMAFQGDIFEWARDHRTHHKGSETESDPHDASRGFFFAHMGWVFVRKHPKVIEEGKKLNTKDLLEDPVVAWQTKYYLPSVLLMCYLLPTFVGHALGSAWNGFWIGGIMRHVWVLHMTWFVNSVAHLWGDKPYDPKINPAENVFVAIAAIGEGWHNYHHKFPTDYAAGEWGILSGQWNPTKLFIDVCALCGLAYDLKRSKTAAITRERVAMKSAALASMEISAKEDGDADSSLADRHVKTADAFGHSSGTLRAADGKVHMDSVAEDKATIRRRNSVELSMADKVMTRIFFGRSEEEFMT